MEALFSYDAETRVPVKFLQREPGVRINIRNKIRTAQGMEGPVGRLEFTRRRSTVIGKAGTDPHLPGSLGATESFARFRLCHTGIAGHRSQPGLAAYEINPKRPVRKDPVLFPVPLAAWTNPPKSITEKEDLLDQIA